MWYWWLSVVPVLALLMLVMGHSRPLTEYDAACARVDADLDLRRDAGRATVATPSADTAATWSGFRQSGAAA